MRPETIGIVAREFGETEIELAIEGGDLVRLRLLLQAGQDPNGIDSLGRPYIELAALMDDGAAALRLLVEFGADINRILDDRGTLLHHVVSAGESAATVTALLELGANVGVRDGAGYSPLHTAAMYGDAQAVSLLLAAGADRSTRTAGGQRPDELASTNHHPVVARLLAE